MLRGEETDCLSVIHAVQRCYCTGCICDYNTTLSMVVSYIWINKMLINSYKTLSNIFLVL